MPIVATITDEDGTVISFDKFLTPDGRVPDQEQSVEEELTASGVRGRRFRDVSERYPEFQAQTIETSSTYTTAVAQCRVYDRLNAKNVRLVISDLAGSSYVFQRVHVKSARAVPVPGAVAGSTAGSTHAAHIMCNFTMVVMELTQGQNP